VLSKKLYMINLVVDETEECLPGAPPSKINEEEGK
jgi:hypothetical protein